MTFCFLKPIIIIILHLKKGPSVPQKLLVLQLCDTLYCMVSFIIAIEPLAIINSVSVLFMIIRKLEFIFLYELILQYMWIPDLKGILCINAM